MAQAAVAQGLDMLAGVGAHQAALAKLEALEEEPAIITKNLRLNQYDIGDCKTGSIHQ